MLRNDPSELTSDEKVDDVLENDGAALEVVLSGMFEVGVTICELFNVRLSTEGRQTAVLHTSRNLQELRS